MSSFRRPKSEAALRLYNLPRRELQALCKQYGIPANKTNVAMADALSACIPADGARPKASAGSSLGVSKTTPMKLKLDKKVGLPETSLASLILTGKRKVSPVKAAEQPTNVEDGGFPKLNTTPLKRGVKRPVQAVQEEKSKVTAVPAFTRALQERFGKAPAVSSPKPPVPTPRKRAAEVAAVVTRRGGDALPPVSFYDLVSTPKKSLVPEVIELNSTGKTAYKMKTRLGCRTEDTTILSSDAAGAGNRVLKGKRVVFADEVEPQKVASPKAEPQAEPETETDTIEISYTEIEFKDAAIHKELFGFQRNTTTNEEPDVMKEELENREDASDRTQETGFEFRDMALHQEIFGAHGKSESECEEVVQSPLDLQQAGTSTSAVELDTLERETCNPPTNYPAEVLHYSNTVPVQDHSVLPSIREDAYEVSDGQGEARQEHTKQHLAQGPDPSPLPNDVSPENLAENPCESSSEAPDHSQPTSLGGPTAEIHNDCEFTLEQEPSLVSSSANVHLVTDEERDLEDTQQHQSENHEVVMLVDGDTKQHQLDNHEVIQDTQQHQSENHEVVMLVDGDTQEHRSENHQGIMLVDGDTKQHQLDNHEVIQDTQQHQSENHEVVVLVDGNTQQHQSENHDVVTFAEGSGDEPLDKQCSEETFVSSVPVPDEAEKAQSSSSLEFDQVQFALGLDEKENTENSLIVATAKRVVADGSELVMSDSSSPSIPLTPATNAQDNSTKRLSGPGSSNIPVTPAVNVQVYSAKRLSGPGSFNIPATPVAKGQDSSNKRLSGPGSFSIPVTPLANAQDNSAKRLSGLRSSNISMTPPTNAQQNTTKYLSVPTSSDIPVTPVTKLKDNSDSALANAATPLTKIQSNIDSTLAKATSILEKLAAWRADAEKKMREGYWEPKFSTVVEGASAGPEVERPLAKTVPAVDRDVPSAKKARPMPKSIVDRDVPSAKKARPIPKSIVGPEKPLTVCEDTDIVSKGDMPSAKKLRISDDLSEVSDKENQSDKSIDSDKSQRRMGGIGKEKKKGKKFEVLKDRSKNLPDHGNGLATIKERTGLVRPGDMSLRKLRAQVKQKVSQLETSKASPLRPQKAWNMSH